MAWYPRRRRPGGFEPLYQAYEPALEVELRRDAVTPRGWSYGHAVGGLGTGVAGLVTYFQPHKRMLAGLIGALGAPRTTKTSMATPYGQQSQSAKQVAYDLGDRVKAAEGDWYEDEGPPFQPFSDPTGTLADQVERSIMGAGHGVGDTESLAQFGHNMAMQIGALLSNEYASSVVGGVEPPEPAEVDSMMTYAEGVAHRQKQRNWKPWQVNKSPWVRTPPTREPWPEPVTIEVQERDPAPGEAPRPRVKQPKSPWVRQPSTATAAPQSTPTVRAQARRDTGGYTTVDSHGYRPMEGTQGVVADLAQGLNWTAASPRDVFASIADKKRPREKSRFDWNRESVRFPLETARYARENDNMGVRNFQYGDPPGPPGPPSVLGDLPCIGAAAVAAAAVI